MAPFTKNEKKNPIVANDNYNVGLKKVVAPLEEREEIPSLIDDPKSVCLKNKIK
jgi:hypothetical protein